MKLRWRFILDTRYNYKNDPGKYPVKVYLNETKKKRVSYILTGVRLSKNQFRSYELSKTNTKDYQSISPIDRDRLSEIRGYLEKAIGAIRVSVPDLRRKIELGEFSVGLSVRALFTRKIDELNRGGQIKSAQSYQACFNHILSYDKRVDHIEELDIEWLNGFKRYLIESKDASIGTTGVYLRNVRAIYNRAIEADENLKKGYPFGKGKVIIPATTATPRAIFQKDIQKLLKYEPKSKKEQFALDFWLFSLFANGMNLKDIIKLKWADYDGNKISFLRQKTTTRAKPERVEVVLNRFSQAVIMKYASSSPNSKGFLFPFIETNDSIQRRNTVSNNLIGRINKGMELVCEAVGIERVTFQSARHSFAVMHHYVLQAPIEDLRRALGHSSLIQTQGYLNRIPKPEQRKTELTVESILIDQYGDEK